MKRKNKKRNRIKAGRIVTLIFVIAAAVSAVLYFIMRSSSALAEFMNGSVSAFFRLIFAKMTDFLPFSLAEWLILLIPLWLFLVVYVSIKRCRRHGAKGMRGVLCFLLCVVCFIWTTFALNYAPGYFTAGVSERLGFDSEEITASDLRYTMERMTEEINSLCASCDFSADERGETHYADGFEAASEHICASYEKFEDSCGFPQTFSSTPKLLVTSPLMTYTHVSGIYTQFTGEININTNYPEYIVISTIAHEMAHQRGIAPEDEASFIAFAVLRSSDDAYLRYCGLLDVYSSVSSALAKCDRDSFNECRVKLCSTASKELRAYSEFFDKYRDSVAADVNDAVNDAYLKLNGTEGTVSYDMVTEFAVRYYRSDMK